MRLKKINFFSKLNIHIRIAILFLAIFGTTTIAFNIYVFRYMSSSLEQDFDDALYNYCVDISELFILGQKINLDIPDLTLDDGKILPFSLGTALIQVRHQSGRIMARRGNFGDFKPSQEGIFEALHRGQDAVYETVSNVEIPNAESQRYRLISFPLESNTRFILQVAVPMTLLEAQIYRRSHLLYWATPLILLISTLASFYLSQRALRPIQQMINTAQGLQANELNTRIPVPASHDEIRNLALTLNNMLGRIEKSFQSQEKFIADASHQILTPVSIIKGELELLLKNLSGENAQSVQSTLQEVNTLSRIVQDMLLLARIDAGESSLVFQNISLTEIIFEILNRCKKIATQKNIKLKFDIDPNSNPEDFGTFADPDLLSQLIFNLIENAIKYSPKNSLVEILLARSEKEFSIEVKDQGPGVREEETEYLFNRFSRDQQMGTSSKPGYGLGLAIAKKIADAHGADLLAKNKDDKNGAIFILRLPVTSDSLTPQLKS